MDGSLLQIHREGFDVDQEKCTDGTPAQLQEKAKHKHFLGFSSVAGMVLPGQEELHRRNDVLEQVQVKNHGISSVPSYSRAARESYLAEMISTVTAEYLEMTSTTSAEENAECGTDTKPSLRGAAVISKQTGHEFVL